MKKAEELHPLEIPEGLWQEISIDTIGLLPRLSRKDAIVVVVDWFTKMIQLRVTTMNVSPEEITKIYWNGIWKLHRIPWKVFSNREPQFVSRFMEDLLKALGIKRILSTAYHP